LALWVFIRSFSSVSSRSRVTESVKIPAMFYYIDDSVVSHLTSGGAAAEDYEALDYLAMGVAEGNHRIGGTRRGLEQLSKIAIFHTRTKSVIQRAQGRVAQEGSLHFNLDVYSQVVVDGTIVPISQPKNGKRLIKCPLRWFDSSHKVQPTVLLGENVIDALTLKKIGEVGTVLANLPYLPIKIIPGHGGGSAIGVVLAINASLDFLCLCIVDSDRSYPGGQLGNTATAVQLFKNDSTYPLIAVEETFGRDLENSLPNIFYLSAFSPGSLHGAMSEALSILSSSGQFDVRAHLDIEKGLIVGKILSLPATSSEYLYWMSKFPDLMSRLGVSGATVPCVASGSCGRIVPAPCNCFIVKGNPTDILQKFVDLYSGVDRYKIASWLDDSIKNEWTRLGRVIVSWCCADARLRI